MDKEIESPGDSKEIKEREKWLKELKSADKVEKDWRDKCRTLLEKYRGDNAKKNTFNILYSNTDTLSPTVYNSKPKPDVRRRWADDDPLGKEVSLVLGRCLEYCVDTDEFESSIELNLYDYLICGRAISRIRYVPSIIESPEDTDSDNDLFESENFDEIEWEQVVLEHVQYDDYRRGPGRSWSEIPWQAFKHRLSENEIAERFGKDKASVMVFDPEADFETKKDDKGKIQEGTTEIWEIWDKDKKQVVFVSEAYHDGLLKKVDDPLKLKGFWCTPKPLYSFIDSTNLIPVPLFALYEAQALELDRISARIIKLIAGLKVRGIYDSTIAELSQLFTGEDNQLFPAQDISIIMDRGGLDKAIWFMDIKPIIEALKTLYEQREQTKQVIYEIMGLSDILRGSSNANETATAQGIKAQWGGMRVNRMQKAVQLYIRDIMRLMAEVIGQKFQIQTLQTMTSLKYPTDQDVQQQLVKWQMQAQQATIQHKQIPPKPDQQITWEQIKSCLASDLSREFKIDVETDSTIAASQQTDMASMKMLLDGIAGIISEFTPVVQSGVMPVEAVKELIMAVIRRAKLGNAVEDAFDKIGPPPPQPQQPSPEVIKAQAEQAKAQMDLQATQMQNQHEFEIEKGKATVEAAINKANNDVQIQQEQLRIEAENQREIMRLEFEKYKAELEAQTQIKIAQMQIESSIKQAELTETANNAIDS